MYRLAWWDYFSKDSSIVVAFWSAKLETERLDNQCKTEMTMEPNPSSILDPGMDDKQHEHWISERMVTDDAMTTEGKTMETIPIDVATPTGTTCSVITGTDCVTDTAPILDPADINDTTSADEAMPRMDTEVSGISTTAMEECEEVDEGGAALLNGEELLELLVRISPVAAGSLTTVGMVRRPVP